MQYCSLSKFFLKQALYKKKKKSVIKMIPFVFWLPWPLICFDIEYETLLVGLFNTCLICSNWITTAHKYSRWIPPLNYLQWESQTEFAFHFETIINLDFKHHGSNFIWNVINLILEYLRYVCAAFVVCTAKANFANYKIELTYEVRLWNHGNH